MSAKSNNQGRAYEYAWCQALVKSLKTLQKINIVKNSSFFANQKAWNNLSIEKQDLFFISANATIDNILELEPIIQESIEETLYIEFQKDEFGRIGDVRDIIVRRNNIDWEVGFSIKHNHSAVKHSRLSHALDFGSEWYNVPCSEIYWNDVKSIFNILNQWKSEKKKWVDLDNKEKDVYFPLLKAFLEEIKRAYKKDHNIVIKLFYYLVGIKDYYKIVSDDKKQLTFIHTFNLYGTLNKPSKIKISAFNIPISNIPTEILTVRFKPNSRTTIEVYMDNGWAFSFRIHSASSYIQPSLKFDIQFISTPISVWNIECKWKNK